jgi:hypothetical protein
VRDVLNNLLFNISFHNLHCAKKFSCLQKYRNADEGTFVNNSQSGCTIQLNKWSNLWASLFVNNSQSGYTIQLNKWSHQWASLLYKDGVPTCITSAAVFIWRQKVSRGAKIIKQRCFIRKWGRREGEFFVWFGYL